MIDQCVSYCLAFLHSELTELTHGYYLNQPKNLNGMIKSLNRRHVP